MWAERAGESRWAEVWATATATLIVQCRWVSRDHRDDWDAYERWFQRRIDESGVLRRRGDVTRRNDEINDELERTTVEIIELRCDVEYGPVYGCHESHLDELLQEIIAHKPVDTDWTENSAVFNFARRELTPADVDLTITHLQARVNDLALSLSDRKNLSDTIVWLRKEFPNA